MSSGKAILGARAWALQGWTIAPGVVETQGSSMGPPSRGMSSSSIMNLPFHYSSLNALLAEKKRERLKKEITTLERYLMGVPVWGF